jgi:hypothetical protein
MIVHTHCYSHSKVDDVRVWLRRGNDPMGNMTETSVPIWVITPIPENVIFEVYTQPAISNTLKVTIPHPLKAPLYTQRVPWPIIKETQIT